MMDTNLNEGELEEGKILVHSDTSASIEVNIPVVNSELSLVVIPSGFKGDADEWWKLLKIKFHQILSEDLVRSLTVSFSKLVGESLC